MAPQDKVLSCFFLRPNTQTSPSFNWTWLISVISPMLYIQKKKTCLHRSRTQHKQDHLSLRRECVFSALEPCWVIIMKMDRFGLGSVIKVHGEGQVDKGQKEGLVEPSECLLLKFWSGDKQTWHLPEFWPVAIFYISLICTCSFWPPAFFDWHRFGSSTYWNAHRAHILIWFQLPAILS